MPLSAFVNFNASIIMQTHIGADTMLITNVGFTPATSIVTMNPNPSVMSKIINVPSFVLLLSNSSLIFSFIFCPLFLVLL